MKRILALLLVICMLLCGCGSDEEESTAEVNQSEVVEESSKIINESSTVEESSSETVEEEKTEDVIRHPLTGEVLKEAWKGTPVTVMINNIVDALPQYGISKADILYEIETEGGITRMIAIFSSHDDIEKIGPVRSMRTYFSNVATSYDSPLFHCGGSWAADNAQYDDTGAQIENFKHVDQMVDGQFFYRDSDRFNYQGYAWEHTLFTSGDALSKAMEEYGFYDEIQKSYGLEFSEDVDLQGDVAEEIEVVFKGGKTTSLVYNSKIGKYEGYQYGDVHLDAEFNQGMSYRNVIVLYANQKTMVHMDYSYTFYDLIGSGTGHFACDGKIVPIKWSRETVYDPFVYTMEDGTALTLGVGNSYIGIVSDTRTVEYN